MLALALGHGSLPSAVYFELRADGYRRQLPGNLEIWLWTFFPYHRHYQGSDSEHSSEVIPVTGVSVSCG